MATLTVRNLQDDVKRRLKIAAAERGLSMEEHVRQLLHRSLEPRLVGQSNLYAGIRELFADMGDVELDIPPRTDMPREVELPE
jgi:plasmid stability protein